MICFSSCIWGFLSANFCLIVQDVRYLTVLSIHVLTIWPLCFELGIWRFKHEFDWLCIWYSNCELNHIISWKFFIGNILSICQSVDEDSLRLPNLLLYNWRCSLYFSCLILIFEQYAIKWLVISIDYWMPMLGLFSTTETYIWCTCFTCFVG